jgi:diaminohydroxyphosphoribosylaminopyrimidine deaminase / 5-amino-6-(5-phosphoribosylamino)uracil reductase
MLSDEHFMQRAIDLALLGGVDAAPNPMVGAVIVHNGRIIGEGWHHHYGGPHAEVNAVASVKEPELLPESTIYVSLEPCAHFGKTPPCANLLVEKRFKRVVIGTVDPFAKVAGQGIAILQNAGIDCTIGVLSDACQELNKRFFTFHEQQRPYVFLKWAQTADGYIDAPRNGNETGIRWISAPETQVLTHHRRAQEQSILTGWKTIANDNPSLTTRAVAGRNPLRIVVDSELKAPESAVVFTDGLPTIVLNTLKSGESGAVRYLQLPDVSVESQLKALYELNILSVIVEGGRHTLQQYIDSGLWDEATVIQGRSVFGAGTSAPVIGRLPDSSTVFAGDTLYEYRRS